MQNIEKSEMEGLSKELKNHTVISDFEKQLKERLVNENSFHLKLDIDKDESFIILETNLKANYLKALSQIRFGISVVRDTTDSNKSLCQITLSYYNHSEVETNNSKDDIAIS